jgi:hypothetical protein
MNENELKKYHELLERDRKNKINTWKTYDETKQYVEFAIANNCVIDIKRTQTYIETQKQTQIKNAKW